MVRPSWRMLTEYPFTQRPFQVALKMTRWPWSTGQIRLAKDQPWQSRFKHIIHTVSKIDKKTRLPYYYACHSRSQCPEHFHMARPRQRRDSPHWQGQVKKTLVSTWRWHPRYFIFTCFFFLFISLLQRQLYRLHGNKLGRKSGMWVINISLLNLWLAWLLWLVVAEGKRDLYIHLSSTI